MVNENIQKSPKMNPQKTGKLLLWTVMATYCLSSAKKITVTKILTMVKKNYKCMILSSVRKSW